MKRKLFATIALLSCVFGGVFAQSNVGVGAQVTSESAIQEGVSYVLQSQAANVPYIADKGTYYAIPNNNPAKEDCVYQFISNGDGTWKIKSVYTGKYWGIPVSGSALVPSEETNAGHWTLNFSNGIAYPTAPDAGGTTRGLDRSSGQLYGYTTGTSGTKQVKIFQLVAPLSNEILPELNNKVINVSSSYANNLTTGQWYVMFDRGTNPKKHGYLYENVSSHKLFNTATVPSGTTTTTAKYLVRLSDAGNGKYYVQTGFGNYFGTFTQATNVPVTSTPTEAITIAKIAGTDGHFYLQSSTSGIVLDANDVGSGDATVVGWGSNAPTSTGGNNDWAFYPVTLEEISGSTAVTVNDVTVTRGYQTCGRGNANSLMLRIDLSPTLALSNASISVSLNAAAQANISSLYIHKTAQTEFIANIPNTPVGTASSIGSTATIDIGSVSAGLNHFWLCATVKDDAELGAILEATLTGITFTSMGETNTLDVPASKTPTRQGMKVFNQQNFVFKPTTDGNRFYRIPAMVLDKNDNIVVAIDRRGENNSDLGNHKIDVSIIRSEDNGRTWGTQEVVAVGNMAIESRYGYGDPVLARTPSGRIICLMACGRNMYFGTGGYSDGTHYNNWIGMLTSDDNGVTWQGDSNGDPIFITEDVFGGRGQSLFVTSGKGLTTEEGAVMFAVNVKRVGNNTSDCYILKTTDDGNTWTLLPNIAYSGCDESKLEQLNDGQLLLSVRQSGNRGWNKGSADGMTWGSQYRTADINGNACNADILYYSRTTKGAKRDILLHSYINTSDRESLQLAMSVDGGESWHDVYNIQPNGSCYSTMQVLSDGSLAILYEDASFSNILSDPFGAGNGFAINFVTITKDQINEWYDELVAEFEHPTVKIVEQGNMNAAAPWGSWNPASGWANKFTTSAASGMAGVVVSATYNALNRQYLNGNVTQRVFVMKPSATGAQNDVFTITAPESYLIEGYSIGGYTNNNNEIYTLTAENGESVVINQRNTVTTAPNFLNVTGINAKSTTITMSNNNGSNNSFASISHFVVYLKKLDKKSLVLLDDDREVEYPNEDRIADNLTAQTIDVTIHGRTLFKDNAWNTLCLPFAVSDFAGTPLEGADVRELNSVSFKNGTLTMNFSDELDAIEAGKPYIVRWTSGDDIKNPVFADVTFEDATSEVLFDNVGMTFKGIYTPFTFEAQDKSKLYLNSENQLKYPKNAITIRAFRAFFDLGDNLVAAEPSATAGAKEITNFALNFGGEATGVSSLDRGEQTADGIYTIDGRKLMGEPTQKGVYIVNGKKVVK